mmetsp:Transcript_11203/g.10881  ORF Transcript_11203/g.10881 Transcript_11203/m.10881 type:complete len:218 (-) Transcript_11203:1281-1934(-)
MIRIASVSSQILLRGYQRVNSICIRSITSGTADTDAVTSSMFDKIAFIGSGKMAQSMIDPLITNGYQAAERISIYDVSTKSMEDIETRFPGIQTTESIGEAVHDANCIVLAVKPQNINESFWKNFPSSQGNKENNDSSNTHHVRNDVTLLSILAGIPVQDFVPSGISKIVRRYALLGIIYLIRYFFAFFLFTTFLCSDYSHFRLILYINKVCRIRQV